VSQTARRALYAQIRAEQTDDSARYVDLRADFVAHDGSEHFLAVGGKWDRKYKRYVENGETAKLLKLHPGQYDAARWFALWLKAHLAGRHLDERGQVIRSLLLAGGRRGGKSDLSTKCGVAYAIATPRSRVWLVSPSIAETEELELALLDWLPHRWYTKLGAPWYRFLLANWSTITLRSAHDPESLKRGRADFVVMNEAQKMDERAFAVLRPQTADKGGLVILAANPPTTASGQWIADYADETQSGRRPAKYIHIDATRNPFVDQQALDDLRLEVDERTYRIERHGEFLPRVAVCFYSWNANVNVRRTPDVGDVTRDYTERKFGRAYDYIAGFDFQIHPFMASVFFRTYADDHADGEPLLWAVDAVTVEGNEDDLMDALENRGYDGARVACVVDASGEWQDAERTKGRGSCDVMRRRKWTNIYLPDGGLRRNPDIVERVAVTNARMCAADGRRRVYSDPRNVDLNQALRKWERKNGQPFRQSKYAHLCDAFSYPLYRLYPRKLATGPFRFDRIKPKEKGGWEDL